MYRPAVMMLKGEISECTARAAVVEGVRRIAASQFQRYRSLPGVIWFDHDLRTPTRYVETIAALHQAAQASPAHRSRT